MKNEWIEKTALEIMSEFMEYCEYIVKTKDGVTIKCDLHRARYTITSDENQRTGEVYLQTSKDDGDMIYSVPEYHTLEYCINKMNEYIKDNFKTRLG